MENWILDKIIKNKTKSNVKEVKIFNDLVKTECGKEILIDVFKIGFVEGYELNKC